MNESLQRNLTTQGRYDRFLASALEVIAVIESIVVEKAREVDVMQVALRKSNFQCLMSSRNTVVVEPNRGQCENDVAINFTHFVKNLNLNSCRVAKFFIEAYAANLRHA